MPRPSPGPWVVGTVECATAALHLGTFNRRRTSTDSGTSGAPIGAYAGAATLAKRVVDEPRADGWKSAETKPELNRNGRS